LVSQRVGSSIEHGTGRSDDNSSVNPRSDGLTTEKQMGSSALLALYRLLWQAPTRRQKTLSLILLRLTTQACFKNIEPHYPRGREGGTGGEKRDKGASCSTDDTILYSLRSSIAMLKPNRYLVRGDLREDAVGIAACQAGSSWIWCPTDPTDAEPVTAIGATDIRDSSMRTGDSAETRFQAVAFRRGEISFLLASISNNAVPKL